MPNTEIIEKITGEGKTGTLNDSMIKELSEGYKILIEKEFSSDYVKPVSYTHLDVYKRQVP
ncbi:hypothetical protein A5885_000895 [Enterococcus sp. 8E11_MSG4843]|uniref:hypothetical protein n=1 Tax=Enterococcus sp. 8E11_MSG4843 TaxID=1834190 RepID=UPI000B3E638D|nr:hypothetical protein [Enterococcus sp. 8E11_MSG4843]OUZ36707.1 hypothetical protein A5885_000895 [Enterococcus sp. 8E11_MSG4843]